MELFESKRELKLMRSFALVLCGPLLAAAAQFSGSVRAADQFVPGATVTARRGETKVTAFTGEDGRYAMELDAGVWEIRIEMFAFTTEEARVTVESGAVVKDWVLSMPKIAGATTAATLMPPPRTPNRPNGGQGRGGRGGQWRQGP